MLPASGSGAIPDGFLNLLREHCCNAADSETALPAIFGPVIARVRQAAAEQTDLVGFLNRSVL